MDLDPDVLRSPTMLGSSHSTRDFKIACEENKGKLDIARLVGYLRRPQCVKPGEKTGRWQQHYYYPPGLMSNYESCMPATPGVVMTTSAKVVATIA